MRSLSRAVLISVLGVGLLPSINVSTAFAQGAGSRGSLGGYGAASSYANPGMEGGGSGAMIIPYGGMSGGFMPSRMGGGSSLSFRSQPSAAMGSVRTSFSLSSMSDGMSSSMSGGMGSGLSGGSRISSPFGASGAMGSSRPMGGGRMPGPSGMSVMPPSFGYPFRQPPSLVPSSGAAGMSM